ncbi:MAG: YjzC family protein [Chloroflexi bacterium]|nr:YjzC family protein [Chloroflexota bacterium]
MAKDDLLKPGEKAPDSGQYVIVGPRGGDAGGQERTVVQGEPLPPTPKPGQKYRITDRTKTQGRSPKRK